MSAYSSPDFFPEAAMWTPNGNDATGESGAVLLTPMCTAAPEEVGELSFDADKSTLRWTALGYDVARGDLVQAETPPAGEAWVYLVRAVNACGVRSWGGGSSASCP